MGSGSQATSSGMDAGMRPTGLSGQYYVRVTSGDGAVATRKVQIVR